MKLRTARRNSRAESRTIGRALYGLMAAAVRSQPRDMSLTSLSTLATLELTGPRRITDLGAALAARSLRRVVLLAKPLVAGLVRPPHVDHLDGQVARGT